jgi:hypothetical protein
MSTPISYCQISAAARGDEKAFNFLVEAMEYNRAWGAFTQFPCECKPRCPAITEAQAEELNNRVNAAIEARRVERAKKNPPRPVGDFSKFIFPVIKNMPPMPPLKDLLE